MDASSKPDFRKIVIADDHAVVRDGLKAVLAGLERVSIVGEAENGIEALALVKTMRPDLLLLDSAMPLARGMEVFGEVRRWSTGTRCAVITGMTSAQGLADWIAVGVDGLFLKNSPPEELARGISMILDGETFVARAVVDILEAAESAGREDLTLRERQVLYLIAEGCSNAAIAERLSISAKTVDNHRTRLMAKLQVHSVAQLIAYALKSGLLEGDQFL
ncbi:LuxR C-terminal-related transcriptional regulator [Psychromarinibacter halotolerans]|uniref:LuxR C-terminal-related transcriptional regulator n=1 Tax=Psychromarinibacter halotolerans TaxID=1775175 RepID=A0ABV7GSS8_9RHOB|nr:response regulator transcription factor [Psychromarinibacter halotolerans]MDF0597573.1 response regulator transcription factor [Psychromarinibacter halotolerans]